MEQESTFRDRLTTNDKDGSRLWVYPKKPKGKFTNYRNWVSYLLLAFMVGAPFIKINGNPLLLFDVVNRKFVLFGQMFWPQDLYLIVFIFITAVVGLVLFTVIFGRIFCGWMCPQTIFMEMVFRKIEYLIEGDYTKQKALDKKPWNGEKIFKKTLKHGIFLGLSFLIGNVLLAYLIGSDGLIELVTDPPTEHLVGLGLMFGFSGAFYLIFARMREQVCTMACPYGRLQGVMMDTRTVVVAYDFERGEPREKLRKGQDREAANLGSCIDCKQCVHVCPTGIDIRNGTQLECINCTACIDACDEMMIKTDQPTGLVRYASLEGIEKGSKFKWTGRMYAYMAVLVAMLGIIVYMFSQRKVLEGVITRGQSTTFERMDDNRVRNIFNYKIINKTFDELEVEIRLEDIEGELTVVGGNNIKINEAGLSEGVMILVLNRDLLEGRKTPITFGMYNKEDGSLIHEMDTKFLGPGKYDN